MNSPLRYLLAVLLLSGTAFAQPGDDVRRAVHLLDYIAQDYPGAVKDGRVISEQEYGEMREFSRAAVEAVQNAPALRTRGDIASGLRTLTGLVDVKAAPEDVARSAVAVKAAIIDAAHLPVAPQRWPDVRRGRELYATACAACHGIRGHGDGTVAAQLQPPPANLQDAERMKGVSPFQAFNTIRLGLPGTSMPSFGALSEDDAWALSFYVVAMRYDTARRDAEEPSVALDVAASVSDEELARRLGGTVDTRRNELAAVRLHAPAADDSLDKAIALLRDAETAYGRGDRRAARSKALAAYLDGIEPVEPRLRTTSPAVIAELEQRMSAVRSAIESGAPEAEVARAVANARESVDKARRALAHTTTSAPFLISMAAAIVLREAFEAILIVVAILSVLRSVGASHAARWVHAGWLAALAVGVAAWFASDALLKSSSLQREVIEAITSLVAVLVLLYMGFWLHQKTEIAKWRAFVAGQVNAALGKGRLLGLAAISFFAVFREVVETVLFLVALSVDGGPAGRVPMFIGVGGALAASILLAWLLVRFSARLPLRTMFTVTAILMMALGVILAGKGLRALQEAGISGSTSIPWPITADLFGVYPTWQTIAAQLLTITVSAVLWLYARPRVAKA
ncbi:MAG TPA: cytochrome c/FTR1 family iron permease, partial [Thermoanaerobaculia bacterium]|nr:cytochrome c/FTR1 family iron permease [Thermoanaerobaculia bacterium]